MEWIPHSNAESAETTSFCSRIFKEICGDGREYKFNTDDGINLHSTLRTVRHRRVFYG